MKRVVSATHVDAAVRADRQSGAAITARAAQAVHPLVVAVGVELQHKRFRVARAAGHQTARGGAVEIHGAKQVTRDVDVALRIHSQGIGRVAVRSTYGVIGLGPQQGPLLAVLGDEDGTFRKAVEQFAHPRPRIEVDAAGQRSGDMEAAVRTDGTARHIQARPLQLAFDREQLDRIAQQVLPTCHIQAAQVDRPALGFQRPVAAQRRRAGQVGGGGHVGLREAGELVNEGAVSAHAATVNQQVARVGKCCADAVELLLHGRVGFEHGAVDARAAQLQAASVTVAEDVNRVVATVVGGPVGHLRQAVLAGSDYHHLDSRRKLVDQAWVVAQRGVHEGDFAPGCGGFGAGFFGEPLGAGGRSGGRRNRIGLGGVIGIQRTLAVGVGRAHLVDQARIVGWRGFHKSDVAAGSSCFGTRLVGEPAGRGG